MSSLSTPTLRQRVVRAGGWSLAGYALSQVVRLGSNLVMTRLLVPEMFGVMAMAWLVITGLHLFSDVGLQQNVVQRRRGNEPAFLDTVWVIQIRRGILICLCAIVIATLVGLLGNLDVFPARSVYADPTLPYVIAVLSLTSIITGFASTKLLEASRNLALNRVTQLEFVSQIAGLICMVGWAIIDKSIWALVAGGISATAVRIIFSHTWLPGHQNRFRWDSDAFREIIDFGKWIFISSVLGFLVNNGDRLILGMLVDTKVLGVYVIAFYFYNSASEVIARIISDVSFPALSEIVRDRPAELKKIHGRFHVSIASVTYFCAGALMVFGETLIEHLYDRRYASAGWMLEILAFALLTIPFRIALLCFMALGLPKLLSHVIAVRLVALFVLTPLAFWIFEMRGAVWAIVISHYSSLPMIIWYEKKHGLFNWTQELLLLPLVFAGMFLGVGLNLLL